LSRREKTFWLAVGAIILLLFLWLIPARGEICDENAKHCATYSVVPFLIVKIGKFLDSLGVAITALATFAIAWFTLSLRQSTDKLWDAGNEQRLSSEKIAERQSKDMQDSIQAATASANAAIASNQIAVTNAVQQLRAYVTVQEVNMVTHRTAMTMGAYGPVEGPPHTYRFSVILKNGGMTPAVNAKVNINHGRFNNELAASYHFPDSNNFGNALIGPGTVWHTPSVTVPAHELQTPLVGQFHYLWGWIEYDDIFSGTLRHRTEFCFRISCELLQPSNEAWFSFIPHLEFKAADSDCLRPIDPTA
jgi:hypothetical protein